MQEIRDDIKRIRDDVQAIRVHVAVNTESLQQHMIRTALNEKRIERAEDWSLRIFAATGIAIVAGIVKLFIG